MRYILMESTDHVNNTSNCQPDCNEAVCFSSSKIK